jgi:hypothetical protein
MLATVRRVSALLVAAAAILMVTATASYALVVRSWNSASDPLTVHAYGTYAWSYGTWDVSTHSDGTRSRLHAYQSTGSASHKVYETLKTYVNAGYCVTPKYTSCSQQYYYYDRNTTQHTSSYAWVYEGTSTGLTATADYARGNISTRMDVPWRTDPSSGDTYTEGVQY